MFPRSKMFDLKMIKERKQLRWILVACVSALLFAAAKGQDNTLCDSLSRFTCDDGICISKARLCDGFWDCAEGEDELYCDSKSTSCERDETMARMNNYNCRNRCESHADCGSRRRRCICDDECGKSCINLEASCRNAPAEVGNSVGYEVQRRSQAEPPIVTKRYRVGDVVKYQCKVGMKLIGPLPRCNGRGQWSREIPKCSVIDDDSLGLFRVTGGRKASKKFWPWQVLVTKKSITPEETLSRRSLHGGGSLLNEKWVLTAAHLFIRSDLSSLSSYVISTGVFKRPLIGEKIDKNIQMFTPAALYSHREFSKITYENDIALLKIGARFDSSMSILHDDTGGVTFGPNTGKVILPCTISEDESWWVGKHESLSDIRIGQFNEECLMEEKYLIGKKLKAVVTGFGHMDKRSGVGIQTLFHPPEYLQQASLKLGDTETCQTGVHNISQLKGINLTYTEKLICTNGGPVDACQGDSGGPLVRKEIDWLSKKIKWIQIGIVSYGYGCGLDYPGFYTNVARFIYWIKETIEIDNDKVQKADMSKMSKKICALSSALENMQHKLAETQNLESKVDEMNAKIRSMEQTISETRGLESRIGEMNVKIEKLTRFISETRGLDSRVDEMNAKIQNVRQTISAMCDGVIYNGRCFWAEVHSSKDINIADAQELCRKRGSRLADIYSKTHYDRIFEYLTSKLDGRPWIYVWTGMRKIYGNPNAQMSDNTQAPYTKARTSSSYWNAASREFTHVCLVLLEPFFKGSDEGMSAARPTWNEHGALCQSQ